MPGVKAAILIAKPGETLRFAGQEVAAIERERPAYGGGTRLQDRRCITLRDSL